MTDEEKRKVEDLVNEQVGKNLPVTMQEMPIEEAEKIRRDDVSKRKIWQDGESVFCRLVL